MMKLPSVILETGDVTLLAGRRRDRTMSQGAQLVPNRQGNGASAEPPGSVTHCRPLTSRTAGECISRVEPTSIMVMCHVNIGRNIEN